MNKNLKEVIYSLHSLERKILPHLISVKTVEELSQKSNLHQTECITALQLLEQKEYLELIKKEETKIVLDTFGEKFAKEDLPEIQVLLELGDDEISLNKLDTPKEIVGSAMGELKKHQFVETRKDEDLYLRATEKGKEFLKNYSNPLVEFEGGILEHQLTQKQKAILKNFEKRKGFLKKETSKYFTFELFTSGKELVEEFNEHYKDVELEENLTTDMLKTGSWKDKEFRYYDVDTPTSIPEMGRRHPMLEANEILSNVFLEMGFKEMKGPLVESAFWNMDVMWIPQDHPARDEQDTFYLGGESEIPEDLVEKVCEMHERGIKETHTPKGDFSVDISKKRLLRTHSTSTSFRVLSELGEKLKNGENVNGKYFYLANVFRNEAIDATHLAEFYQGEGFIIGDDLSLGDLMGFVKEYLTKLGYHGIRFKPTFNPYTEPSMEAHVYDPEIGKSYALINSGIFRPETLQPLGLESKRIIAWGFGASRIAAKLAKKESMREITGATCDFNWLKTREIMTNKVTFEETKNRGDEN